MPITNSQLKTSEFKPIKRAIAPLPTEVFCNAQSNGKRRIPSLNSASSTEKKDKEHRLTIISGLSENSIYSSDEIKISVNIDPELSETSKQAQKIANILPTKSLVFSSLVMIVCIVFVFILQFACIVKMRYDLSDKKVELTQLSRQRDELLISIERKCSLKNIELQAKEIGLVLPQDIRQIDNVATGELATATVNSDKSYAL